MIRLCFLIILFVVCDGAFSYQSKTVKDHETASFYVSSHDYSRIFVTGDRITSVKGQGSLYDVQEFKDSEDGVLFVRPRAATDQFTIFISTELNHHFTLRLSVKNIGADSIEIKPLTPVAQLASKWETNGHYTQSLVNLLKVMVNKGEAPGYALLHMVKTKPVDLKSGLSMQLLKVYRGSALQGEVWLIMNRTKDLINIRGEQFYREKVRAISIAKEKLLGNEQTFLYRITST